MPLLRLILSARPFAALCLCLASAAAFAADYGDLHWRLIGPFRGGRVLAAAGVPGQPQHFYFGAVNGGVWESIDAGRTWQPIFDGQPVGSIGALAIAPSDPNVIYVGSGEADMRSDIAQGDGMYRSGDAGKHWTKIGLADSQQIGRIIVSPKDPNTLYVAALGHPYGPNAERGVFRSRDGGAHWQRVLGKGEDTGAIDLAFEPGNPQVIYAAMWQARRTPWNIYPPASGPGSGLYKSSDGGDTWTQMQGVGEPGACRPHRRRDIGQRAVARVCARRWPEGRPVSLRRQRRALEADDGRCAHLATRLVLRADHRGSGQRRSRLCLEHHRAALRRWRPAFRAAQGRCHRR